MKRFRGSKSTDQLYKDIKIGIGILLQHLRWMRHLQGMDDGRNTKKIYQANVHQKQPKVRPKARWKDDAEDDRREMATVNWRHVVQNRDGWRRATREVLILLGEWSHKKRRKVEIYSFFILAPD
jgi:hypothetical protein